MRILFDTNVLVDAAVSSRPHYQDAVFLINEVESSSISGVIAPLSFGTIWYLGAEHYETDPRPLIEDLSQVMDLAPMGRPVLQETLEYDAEADFEDMYLAEAGAAAGAGIVVTCNVSDFAPTTLSAYHPRELVRVIG